MENTRRIIDRRKKEKYMMDDEYLNGQAKLCGWQGTIVYTSLCRHANINQESFPSIKLMAEQHSVSRPTILKGVENLSKRKVIEVLKTRTKDGKWLNNKYILLDKSEWDYSSQVNVVDTGKTTSQVNVVTQPSQCGLPDVVNDVDTKETHREGNTSKETHIAKNEFSREGIPKVIELFKTVNPAVGKLYGNTTQRSAAERLIKILPFEQLETLIGVILPKFNSDKYTPGRQKSITPLQFEDNLGHIKSWMSQKHQNQKTIISEN